MMREHFETQLDKLNNELILMGSFVEEACQNGPSFSRAEQRDGSTGDRFR